MADHNLFTHKAFRQTAQSHALWATGVEVRNLCVGLGGGGGGERRLSRCSRAKRAEWRSGRRCRRRPVSVHLRVRSGRLSEFPHVTGAD
jgi:hypothetical protein